MVPKRSVLIAFLSTTVLACCRGGSQRELACASPTWSRQYSGDSAISICLPSDFRPRGESGHVWARGEPTSPNSAWISVAALDSAGMAREWPATSWPPRLESVDAIHSTRVDSGRIEIARIGGREVEIHTGLVTASQLTGVIRAPTIQAGWRVGVNRYVFAQGMGKTPADLEDFKRIVRSCVVRPVGRY